MDPISNMLITIKNGGNAGKERVHVPYAKFTHAIAKGLLDEGYISGYEEKKLKRGPVLEIEIAYVNDKPRINNLKRISKPSRRLYAGIKDIYPVRQGTGRLFLSTPKGVLTGENAQKELVGGELLFEIW